MKRILTQFVCLSTIGGCALFEPDIEPTYCVKNYTKYVANVRIVPSKGDTLKLDSVNTKNYSKFVNISQGKVKVIAILEGYPDTLEKDFIAKVNRKYTISTDRIFIEQCSIGIFDDSVH